MPDLVVSLERTPVARALAAVLLAFILAALATLSLAGGVTRAGDGSREEQLRFMWAMAGQESHWDYYARNRSSGAFGKYQIMPFNWPVWAEKYLGDSQADQTPWNQEQVAYGKMRDLYRWLGSWKRVAYWWLTGRTDRDQATWSSYARDYVIAIMQSRKQAPADGGEMPPRTDPYAGPGDWRRSAARQKLRVEPDGVRWSTRGRLRDGQVLRVREAKATPDGVRWIRVLTADGRLGWLQQSETVPTWKPSSPARWRDVVDTGPETMRMDRHRVRPRPH